MIGARIGRDLMRKLVEAGIVPKTVRDVTIHSPLRNPVVLHCEILVTEPIARVLGEYFTQWADEGGRDLETVQGTNL